MKLTPYWRDTAPRFTGAVPGPVEGRFDVAIVGGGFTGLSAARALAKAGVSTVLLEAHDVGHGGSGRNGGHLNNGLAHSYLAAKTELGAERAKALYQAFDRSVDLIESIVAEEQIDCAFRRSGKLKLASKAGHFDALKRNFEAVHQEVDPDTDLLSAEDLRTEVGSGGFHGAMLSRKAGMMHMGRYVTGLAEAAVRHGASIYENAPVTDRKRENGGWRLTTPRGELVAERVILATNAYTHGPFSYFRRRLVPVGSFVVATRPLSEAEAARTLPGDRTCVTTKNIGNYFRLSPDRRLIFGGRARFSATSDADSESRSGAILQAGLGEIFPHLAGIEIDYCWGGLVGMTRDRYPRAGEADGVAYAMGYSGHGAQFSSLMGTMLADMALGRAPENPLAGLDWPAIPGHFGKPWFLPAVGLYYRLLDRLR
ncbi:NAD(P)/FAD-dependent oxidoreductase [Rhodovibrio salinarum]|uniref:FAD-binding oxidoreductase n=1 Tax=Rhodovibrio salinarum TaxID=1087 RepID=A0A934V373_9PROT|nr:FAD-binding oxidoreductase [Rhodovibrio salinarum]MBK1699149.1 FAD-binding oxidoreductase [Rhodovibrio salinarum]